MQELDDIALLRQYAERGSEDAFAALVARHINKVYSLARRHTANPHSAEEITQAVFVILARKANRLCRHARLSGWIYQTARLASVTFVRGEIRRARREQEAHMQTVLDENDSAAWREIAPLLDPAMAGLSEADRHAVVLRFFDGKSLKEVGAALGANEDAAKKRVSRALDSLRGFFARHGVHSSADDMAKTISANSVQAAPVMLAKTVTAVALAKGATASVSTLTLIQGALKVMAWTKAKTAIVTGAVVLLVVGTATVTVTKIAHHRQGAAAADRPSDAASLQGTWSGHEVSANAGPGACSMIIQGNKLEFHGADPREWYKATFTLREDTTPKQETAVITDCPFPQYVGKTDHAIYEVQNGTLTFAGNEPGDPAVPTSFDDPNSRKFVFTKNQASP